MGDEISEKCKKGGGFENKKRGLVKRVGDSG